MSDPIPPASLAALAAAHRAQVEAGSRLRARDAAQALGASEAALVASGALGEATPLRPDWLDLLRGLTPLGRVMALTRNALAVHERKGVYESVEPTGHALLVLGPDIDLRLFPRGWAHAYALGGERPSIQIFANDGSAVHKVYATEGTDRAGWDALVAAFAAPDAAEPPIALPPAVESGAETPVDAAALRAEWLELKDTHDFFGLLRRHGASRRQAFRLAGEDLAQRLPAGAAAEALRQAAALALPIMLFVGNRHAIQIHTGPVSRLVDAQGWFNVLDPDFNLHLKETEVAEIWRVVKPTADGAVTSIELLDAQGETVAMLFGARKPGQPELPAWRALAEGLAGRPLAA
ncbi:hemin-degrading factor [Roseomonas sp. 18066]|uniref:hemin-degrading factor n=1 Tax=Roseomonas sp. 18066 TaxID=2681412 RepID=UPI0013581C4D|nr:ChuX/HutX family heme-like substrate-binding protein [Roseomonas sp. 18066]